MTHTAMLIAVMSAATILLRFLPFLIFDRNDHVPSYILFLGRVLPSAIIGMLVVYCLKDTVILRPPYGIPELIGLVCVAGLQIWKRNPLISILIGTLIHMFVTQMM